jgi:hypothetical protein
VAHEVLAAVISGSGAIVVAVTSLIVNTWAENRRGRRQSEESQAQRAELAVARADEYQHQRTERSYADRRDAISAFLTEVDKLADWAAQAEYEDLAGDGRGAPSGYLDGAEYSSLTKPVEQARSRLDLLASPNSRTVAEALARAVTILATEWRYADFDKAREAFIDAARDDLALPQYKKVTATLVDRPRQPHKSGPQDAGSKAAQDLSRRMVD